jgi:hypothetical protein
MPAVCFWYVLSGPGRSPDVAVQGLRSAILVGGVTPHLYSYVALPNVPAGCLEVDANTVMPLAEFKQLIARGVRLPVISDLLRLRALVGLKAEHAWFWDVDILVLKDLHNIGVKPDAFNHVLSTMEVARSKLGHTTWEFEKYYFENSPAFPRDKVLLIAYYDVVEEHVIHIHTRTPSASSQIYHGRNVRSINWLYSTGVFGHSLEGSVGQSSLARPFEEVRAHRH